MRRNAHPLLPSLLAVLLLGLASPGAAQPIPTVTTHEPLFTSPTIPAVGGERTGPGPKPAAVLTDECEQPFHQDLENDPVVQWAFKKALWDSVGPHSDGYAGKEAGGWIYQCRTYDPTSFEALTQGPPQYYLDVEFIPFENREEKRIWMDDATYRPHKPGSEDCRTVGTFHTHPTPGDGPASRLSTADVDNGETRGVPAFMIQNRTEDLPGVGFPAYNVNRYAGWNQAGVDNFSYRCDALACNEPDGFNGYNVPDQLPEYAGMYPTPVDGAVWNGENLPGTMVCSAPLGTMPLAGSNQSGTIDVQDGGQTLVAEGFGEDLATIIMHAVPGRTGRYRGSVGGTQLGVPMIINFCWQLITDRSITGYMRSEVAVQGVVCNMSRDFMLRSEGTSEPPPEPPPEDTDDVPRV